MIEQYGLKPDQREPYTFTPRPLPRRGDMAMQGYATNANTIETMRSTIEERPEVVQCFVDGSIRKWYNFLYGANSVARELIMAAAGVVPEDLDRQAALTTRFVGNGVGMDLKSAE